MTVRRLGILALSVALLCGAGWAQGVVMDPTPPSRAQVLSLMAAMGIRQGVDNSLRKAQENVKASARAAYKKKNPDASAADLKKLDTVFDTTPLFGFEDISETLIEVYQKNLSAADVQAGIDFYTSETGQHLLSKLSVILRESNESSQKLVQQKLGNYADAVQRKLEAFEAEMEKAHPAGSSKPPGNAAPATDSKSK